MYYFVLCILNYFIILAISIYSYFIYNLVISSTLVILSSYLILQRALLFVARRVPRDSRKFREPMTYLNWLKIMVSKGLKFVKLWKTYVKLSLGMFSCAYFRWTKHYPFIDTLCKDYLRTFDQTNLYVYVSVFFIFHPIVNSSSTFNTRYSIQ